MMNASLQKLSKNIEWEYSEKQVSAWGGMRLMKELITNSKIMEEFSKLPLQVPGSNSGYSPIQIIECFFVSVWLGALKYTHAAMLKFDEVLKEIFNWKRYPSASTFSRFFRKFTQKLIYEILVPINKWFFSQISIENLTLDIDSSVITRYGKQEGAKIGYNPNKRGRASHHPIIAFVAEMRMVANAWLRPGNTQALSNAYNFLLETLDILEGKKIGLLRADSGFFGGKFFEYLENKIINYIIACRLTPLLKLEISKIKNWLNVDDGIEIAEIKYQSSKWDKERRMIVIRQSVLVRPKAIGKMLNLFGDDEIYKDYRYQCLITNLDIAPYQVWFLYRQRADSENRIKELKYDFAFNGFCSKSFYATDSAFRFTMIAYNLMSLFRQVILKQKVQHTLSTLRFKCFAIGSWIVKKGRKKVLKLAVVDKRRQWLDGLFARAIDLSPPFAF